MHLEGGGIAGTSTKGNAKDEFEVRLSMRERERGSVSREDRTDAQRAENIKWTCTVIKEYRLGDYSREG